MRETSEQRAIIEAPAAELLVSAAAGSGKTYTMTHRVVERVKSGALSIDACLVLTFTEKAAESMRSRMAQVLREAASVAVGTQRGRLREQELRLRQASISTIHAFCRELMKRHGSLLALQAEGAAFPDEDAVVLEAAMQQGLLREAIEQGLEEAYRAADQHFLERWRAGVRGALPSDSELPAIWALSDHFGDAKGDRPLRELLEKLYGFLRSMPDYRSWLENALAAYHEDWADFDRGASAAYCRAQLRLLLEAARPGMDLIDDYLGGPETPLFKSPKNKSDRDCLDYNEAVKTAYLRTLAQLRACAARLADELNPPSWDELHALGRSIELPAVRKGGKNEAKAAIIDATRRYLAEAIFYLNASFGSDTYKDSFRYVEQAVFVRSAAELRAELAQAEPLLRSLVDLLLDLDERYERLKLEQNGLDFSDLEHYALRLARLPEVKAYYRRSVAEIYVDEYQDTSSIQEAILTELSAGNRFMVGDIKQSIYRFRHANPSLFVDRYTSLKDALTPGSLFELHTNFRSAPAILRAVNQIFSCWMTQAASGIDYRRGHALGIPQTDTNSSENTDIKAASAENAQPALQVLCYADSRPARECAVDQALLFPKAAEALTIAGELTRIIEAEKDKGACERAADIAVLARTHQSLAEVAGVLNLLGIDYSYTKECKVESSLVLRTLIALLRLLENPLQDNYLSACLLHLQFWGGFSPSELLQIKRYSLEPKSGEALDFASPFYQVLDFYAQNAPEGPLKSKLLFFRRSLDDFRQHSLELDLNALLHAIYEDLGLRAQAAAENGAAEKLRQLEDFAQWAAAFERPGTASLHALNQALAEREDVPDIAGGESEETPAFVQLLTFHHSKGLEFDYVFICGGDQSVKLKKTNILAYSERHGLACRSRDPLDGGLRDSLIQQRINALEADEDMAEYLRLLYVALTRPKRRLYFLVPLNALGAALSFLDEWAEELEGKAELEAWLIRKAAQKNLLSLLFLAWRQRQDFHLSALAAAADALRESEESAAISHTKTETEAEAEEETEMGEGVAPVLCGQDFVFRFLDCAETLFLRRVSMPETEGLGPDAPPLEQLRSILVEEGERQDKAGFAAEEGPFWDGSYPYPLATRTGIKYSVSEIKRRARLGETSDDESEAGLIRLFEETLPDLSRTQRPLAELQSDHTQRGLSGAELGTLLHLALRYLRPAHYLGLQLREAERRLEAALEVFLSAGLLRDANERAALWGAKDELLAWLQSDCAAELARCDAAEAGTWVYREIPFTLAWSARALLRREGLAEDDKLLVQGVVDLWYQLGEKVCLIDFKSDKLEGDDDAVRAELLRRYGVQLEIYAQAVERELSRPVNERLIWLIRHKKAYRF